MLHGQRIDVLVLGDAHATEPDNRAALRAAYRASGASVALQAGDLGWYDLPVETYFIAGNNEDFDVIEMLRTGGRPPGVSNATLLHGTAVGVEGRRVAGLSGNYAPSRYDRPRGDLEGDRRRHFTREDVARTRRLDGVEVLLVHEAPSGLPVDADYPVGCAPVDDLLAALDPELCLVGHHHQHAVTRIGGTRVVGLAHVRDSYYELDPATLALERRATPI